MRLEWDHASSDLLLASLADDVLEFRYSIGAHGIAIKIFEGILFYAHNSTEVDDDQAHKRTSEVSEVDIDLKEGDEERIQVEVDESKVFFFCCEKLDIII